MNDVVGFANFDTYEQRKSCFIPDGSVYERFLIPMAFLNFLKPGNPKRYMEGRVTPKGTVVDNSVSVTTMDNYVKTWQKGDEKAFLLAQGYMPAQEFHVLKNPLHEDDPWYYVSELSYPLRTPEYTFNEGSLMRPGY